MAIVAGFLATVFANFDVSPELSGTEHSSPGSVQQQGAAEPHYSAADSVTGEEGNRKQASCYVYILAAKQNNRLLVYRLGGHESRAATGDRDARLRRRWRWRRRRRNAERRHGNHSAGRTRGKLRLFCWIRLQCAPRQRLQVQRRRNRKLCELPEQRHAAGRTAPGSFYHNL